MKSVAAVLLAVLAVAHAGVVAGPGLLAAPGIATQYTALTLGGAPIAANIGTLAAPLAAPIAAPLAASWAAPVAAPLAASWAAPIAAPLAAHVAAPVAVGAGYTAVTRGAVHTAPLPGHAIGSTHVNVQPAPGTL